MNLVIDANIIFAMMIKKGITERLLLSDDLHLYAPEYLLIEIKEHETEIMRITKRPQDDFIKVLAILENNIGLIPISEFKNKVKDAERLLEDKDDAAHLALCIAKKISLWSNDNGFKKQKEVKVYTTQELIKLFRLDE